MSVSGVKQSRKGFGRNQSVRKLRELEGAAQPGEVNPV
jgi:hypothetical protein